MKVLTCISPGHFEYSNEEMPVPKKDHAIIKVKKIGICGTDLHAFEGTQPFFNYPRVLGHELCGEIVELNGYASSFILVCVAIYARNDASFGTYEGLGI